MPSDAHPQRGGWTFKVEVYQEGHHFASERLQKSRKKRRSSITASSLRREYTEVYKGGRDAYVMNDLEQNVVYSFRVCAVGDLGARSDWSYHDVQTKIR